MKDNLFPKPMSGQDKARGKKYVGQVRSSLVGPFLLMENEFHLKEGEKINLKSHIPLTYSCLFMVLVNQILKNLNIKIKS